VIRIEAVGAYRCRVVDTTVINENDIYFKGYINLDSVTSTA